MGTMEERRTQRQQLKPNQKNKKLTEIFNRRKKGILKKARDFCTLCGVDTCVIIYGTPSVSDAPNVPEIWPSDPNEVCRIIKRYRQDTIHKKMKPRASGFADHVGLRKKKIKDFRLVVGKLMADATSDWEKLQSLMGAIGKETEVAKQRHTEFIKGIDVIRKEAAYRNNASTEIDCTYSHQIHPDHHRIAPTTGLCYDIHGGRGMPLVPAVSQMTSNIETYNLGDEEIDCCFTDMLEHQLDSGFRSAIDNHSESPLDVLDLLPAWDPQLPLHGDTHSFEGGCHNNSFIHQNWSSLSLNSKADTHCPQTVV